LSELAATTPATAVPWPLSSLGVLVVVDVVVPGDELAAQVGLRRIDAGVENPHDHLRGAGAHVPGLFGVGLRDRPLGRQVLVVRNP
jgi:hypothetical protein